MVRLLRGGAVDMSDGEIAVHLLPAFQRRLPRRWLRSVVERTLEQEGVEYPVEVGVVIADDETVRRLNRDYRGLDEGTDVLAFGFQPMGSLIQGGTLPESPQDGFPFVVPPDQPIALGEVVVSYPQALRQARERGWRVRQEVALLLAHGVLHLLGYDHAEPEEERVMFRKQQDVVRAFFPEAQA